MEREQELWDAGWIWAAHHQYTANCYILFCKTFAVNAPENVTAVRIRSAGTEYRLYWNGTFLGRGSIPSNHGNFYYEEFCITTEVKDLLKKKNCICVVAHNSGVGQHGRESTGGGFALEARIEGAEGTQIIQTDETWDTKVPEWWNQGAPQMFWTIGYQEEVELTAFEEDMRNLLKPGPDDGSDPSGHQGKNWEKAVRVSMDQGKGICLTKRSIPLLSEREVCAEKLIDAGYCITDGPIFTFCNAADRMLEEGHRRFSENEVHSLYKNEKGKGTIRVPPGKEPVYLTFDFGAEAVGYPCLEFETADSGILYVGYSECLNGEGRVDPTRQGIRQADTIRYGSGEHRWEMFGRRAFRYMQITVGCREKAVQLDKVGIRQLYYPFEKEGDFRCDDERLNEIYKISKKTLDLCMKENYEDCPLREKAQYLGDIKTEAVMNYYAFGDTKLIKKALIQFAQAQGTDGWMQSIAPGSTGHNIVDYLPLYIMTLKDYYLFTGDRETLRALYPAAAGTLRWLKDQEDDRGFLTNRPDWWIFIDWADLDKRDTVTALQCLYYRALLTAAKLSSVCGGISDRDGYLQKAARLRENIRKYLYRPEKGAFIDCLITPANPDLADEKKKEQGRFSIQTNCIAVLTGVAGNEEKQAVRNSLQNFRGQEVITGYFKNYEMLTYRILGMREKFWEGFQYWTRMAQRCAGTWWEIFDEKRPGIPNVSLCHGWASAPLNLLAGSVAGIRPLTPGYRDTLLKPDLFTLHEIHVRVPVPGGYVSCDIRREGEKFWLTGSSPKDTTLHILLPALEGGNYDVRYGKSKSERQRKIGSYAYIRLKDREQVDFEITPGDGKTVFNADNCVKNTYHQKEDFYETKNDSMDGAGIGSHDGDDRMRDPKRNEAVRPADGNRTDRHSGKRWRERCPGRKDEAGTLECDR